MQLSPFVSTGAAAVFAIPLMGVFVLQPQSDSSPQNRRPAEAARIDVLDHTRESLDKFVTSPPGQSLAYRDDDGVIAGGVGQQAPRSRPGILILDPFEPAARIDIGEVLDVEDILRNDPENEQLIGPPLNANDLLAVADHQRDEPTINLGEPLDADALDSAPATKRETPAVLVGEPRDADPFVGLSTLAAEERDEQVRDLGPPMPASLDPDDLWPVILERHDF